MMSAQSLIALISNMLSTYFLIMILQVNYVQDMNLGGVFVWAADLDDFKGVCGLKWPLLTTINRHLRGKVEFACKQRDIVFSRE